MIKHYRKNDKEEMRLSDEEGGIELTNYIKDDKGNLCVQATIFIDDLDIISDLRDACEEYQSNLDEDEDA